MGAFKWKWVLVRREGDRRSLHPTFCRFRFPWKIKKILSRVFGFEIL
jgi:hypothetical protein